MKRIALIPVYQPSSVLLNILEELHNLEFEIVVVNDGSDTDCKNFFSDCSSFAEVLHHNQNYGKGFALKTGLQYIYKTYHTDCTVVTVDADGQHLAADALNIIKIAENLPNSLVLGSRKLSKNIPFRSRFGNYITSCVFYLSTGCKIYDTQTGLRAFDGKLIPKMIEIEGERYEYEMNVLLRFAKENIPIVEKEIETIYLDNNSLSHFNAVKDSARIYKEIIKFSASSFVSFLIDYIFYGLLLLLGCEITISNVVARVLSASVNFTLNRKVVFKSREKLFITAIKYLVLALCVLVGNTAILNLFVNQFGINRMIAKLLTEMLLYVISWIIQRTIVFKGKGSNG